MLFLLQACTSMHSLQGAKTIEPDTWEVAVGGSLQQNNPVSISTKIPAPQMVLSTRYGWKPNMDVGAQLFIGGGAVDVRYQFARVDDWYFAVAPTISGLYAGVYGNVSLQLPVRAQRELNDKWSITLGLTPATQQFIIQLDPFEETLVNSLVGNTIRFERQGEKVRWGCTLDGQYAVGRNTPVALSGGIDMSWVRQSKRERNQKE